MDQIQKALKKLSAKERRQLEQLLDLISLGKLQNLDVKKLVGKSHVYRVRKGDLRIIFEHVGRDIRILTIERRSTTTYRNR
jgi:mRNA-degrading endonuclease RelE of RelBE toxin-antitoxin system